MHLAVIEEHLAGAEARLAAARARAAAAPHDSAAQAALAGAQSHRDHWYARARAKSEADDLEDWRLDGLAELA